MALNRATTIGFFAVLLWALLALLTVKTSPVPPFQLNAMAFLVGAVIGFVWMWRAGTLAESRKGVRWPVWVMGIAGLFGYHFFYFSALRLAPPAQAGLIAYLWPLLIVLFSGLLPGETLRFGHIAGAIIAFAGAALLVGNAGGGIEAEYLAGYGLAALCALTWSSYSVLSRRAGSTPTGIVAYFCLATSLLATGAHLIFEETRWPAEAIGWISVLLLGLGPVGLAFYLWDIGMKKGNIQILGVASYAAPLLSTLILVVAGIAEPTGVLFAAAALIAGGALLAGYASKGR